MAKPLDTVIFGVLGASGGLATATGTCAGSCATCLQCYAAGGVAVALVIAARLRGGRNARRDDDDANRIAENPSGRQG